MSKEMWITEHEQLQERYNDGEIGYDEFAEELKHLGFVPKEITDEHDTLVKDMDLGQAGICSVERMLTLADNKDTSMEEMLIHMVKQLPQNQRDRFDDEYAKLFLPKDGGLSR